MSKMEQRPFPDKKVGHDNKYGKNITDRMGKGKKAC